MMHHVETIKALNESKRNTWHILHFIATIIFIPWVFVWILCAVINHRHNKSVDIEIARVYDKMKDQEIQQ